MGLKDYEVKRFGYIYYNRNKNDYYTPADKYDETIGIYLQYIPITLNN